MKTLVDCWIYEVDTKIRWGKWSQDSSLEIYSQVVKVGEGWLDLGASNY